MRIMDQLDNEMRIMDQLDNEMRIMDQLDAAYRARDAAPGVWAKNYWTIVIEALLRKARRD